MDDVTSHDVYEDRTDPFFFSAVDGTFFVFSPLRSLG